MARNKKEVSSLSLSALGLWLGLWQALIKEILGLGGNDNTLRRVISDPEWRRKAAEFFIDAAPKTTETFVVSVNPNDLRWKSIDRTRYAYADSDLTVDDFPVRDSATEVTMMYVTFDHDPTTKEVLDEIKRRDLKDPDRAQVESFHGQHPEERQKHPVIGLCGSRDGRHGGRLIAYVRADSLGVSLYWSRIGNRWDQDCRFLAVSKPR